MRNKKLIKGLEPVPGQLDEPWILRALLVTCSCGLTLSPHSPGVQQDQQVTATSPSSPSFWRCDWGLSRNHYVPAFPTSPHRSVSPGLFRPPWARPPGQDNTSSLLSKANRLLRTILFSPVYRAQEVLTDGNCPHQPHWLPFHWTAEAIHIWKNVKSLM